MLMGGGNLESAWRAGGGSYAGLRISSAVLKGTLQQARAVCSCWSLLVVDRRRPVMSLILRIDEEYCEAPLPASQHRGIQQTPRIP